ncbi:hypothetical protein SAMN02746065_12023 [Desulfocicer vacuolatum DSM 3385]|uniref:Uncharacterized protein n=1 Tax=Desulfocicer vacuolatum DSM 3385 TaxID=1121400 RepID=A0A1W2DSI2_9BACT|nr:hypothetical protein [Desulfocicer vacuolatum]SMD00369.1 hypothetical protein SAMN02746065_12023 [Desulfocicer vacuolatum DSM 3385]
MTTKTTENKSRFYVAQSIRDAKEKIQEKIKTYNEKYMKEQLETGRGFIHEFKSDPVKTVDDLIGDSHNVIQKIKSARMEILQKKMDTTKKDVHRQLEKINKTTHTVCKGIEGDAKLIAEDLLDLGKKNLDKMSLKKKIEKKIFQGIDAIPEKLNIPSKKDIDDLRNSINRVNQKLDGLNKK